MTKKKTILDRIREEEQLRKIAQDAGQGEGNVDKTTADKMADDIFDKLFEQTLKESGIKDLG